MAQELEKRTKTICEVLIDRVTDDDAHSETHEPGRNGDTVR